MFKEIYKAIPLPGTKLELLNKPSEMPTGIATEIDGEYLRFSSDDFIRFKVPDKFNYDVDACVQRESLEFIGLLDVDDGNYFFPIGKDWIYEENDKYKFQKMATDNQKIVQEEIIINGGS